MTSRVLVAIRVAADPARAFAVFTEEIGEWWQPDFLFQITPRGDGRLSFEPGPNGRLITTLKNGKTFEIGRIKVWEPGARLVFSWRMATFTRDQSTEVEVRFEPVGEETRITVEHTAWDTIPQDHVARHNFPEPVTLKRVAEWWQGSLAAYKARAGGQGPAHHNGA
jgi:uncharacterized protein YndB with AHSA1/START domain